MIFGPWAMCNNGLRPRVFSYREGATLAAARAREAEAEALAWNDVHKKTQGYIYFRQEAQASAEAWVQALEMFLRFVNIPQPLPSE